MHAGAILGKPCAIREGNCLSVQGEGMGGFYCDLFVCMNRGVCCEHKQII